MFGPGLATVLAAGCSLRCSTHQVQRRCKKQALCIALAQFYSNGWCMMGTSGKQRVRNAKQQWRRGNSPHKLCIALHKTAFPHLTLLTEHASYNFMSCSNSSAQH